MKVLAIDPGASGGLAWILPDEVCAQPMPETEGDVVDFLRARRAEGIDRIVIEDQNGFCGNAAPGSAMFNFGRGFGFILGCSQTLGYSIELVRPQKWQKALSLGSKKDFGGSGPWKRHLKEVAQRLYPNVSVSLKTADALLILSYSKKQNEQASV